MEYASSGAFARDSAVHYSTNFSDISKLSKKNNITLAVLYQNSYCISISQIVAKEHCDCSDLLGWV